MILVLKYPTNSSNTDAWNILGCSYMNETRNVKSLYDEYFIFCLISLPINYEVLTSKNFVESSFYFFNNNPKLCSLFDNWAILSSSNFFSYKSWKNLNAAYGLLIGLLGGLLIGLN